MKLKALLAFTLTFNLAVAAFALSPFQTVAGVGGPMPGTSMSCSGVVISSFTSTQILAANATRMAVYVVNTSSTTNTNTRPPVVWLSSGVVTSGTAPTDYSTLLAIPITPIDFRISPSTATVIGSTPRFDMTGGSVWQGAIYGVSDAASGHVNVCELNP